MKALKLVAGVSVSCLVWFTACKKNSSTDVVTEDNTYNARLTSNDESALKEESDVTDNDINNIATANRGLCGAGNNLPPSTENLPDDATVDSSQVANRKIRVTFSGNSRRYPCRYRTGIVDVQLIQGNRWIDQGAVLQLTFINYKVVDSCRNRTLTLNGVRTITNVSGGNTLSLVLDSTLSKQIVHRVRSYNFTASFTDTFNVTKTAVWNVARLNTWKITRWLTNINPPKPVFQFTTNGDTTINGYSNTVHWGTTRNGKPFQTYYSSPIVSNSLCQFNRPTSGVLNSLVASFPLTITFGVDANGNPVTSGCASYYKVVWSTLTGSTVTSIRPY